jgi:hypothetical protein
MTLKSPYTTQVERGAYSAIVCKEGDCIIAEDEVGNAIEEGSNGATVIQAAIDSCGNGGRVILADLFDINTELTFPSLAWTSFASGITLQGFGNKTGINYTPVSGYGLKFEGQSSILPCAHHTLENFLVTAPNTTDGAIGTLGGVLFTTFRDVNINNCPNGKAMYTSYNATYGNNMLNLYNVVTYNCKYGLYATGGPSLFIKGGKFTTGLYSGVPTALEALYYTVTGYATDGYKQLHTEDLELLSNNTDQRTLYIRGDEYFTSTHKSLYDDAGHPIYIHGGRNVFSGCVLGPIESVVGTQIVIDQLSRNVILETKDPTVILADLQTPFYIDANSMFITTTGTPSVVDSNAANGKCVELDAEDELVGIYYTAGSNRMNTKLGVGTYLATIYTKDTNQVTNDLKLYVQSNEGGYHEIHVTYHTLTASYNGIPYVFTLESGDVGDANIIYAQKHTATANTISIDYLTLQQLGTNFHQTVGGGHQFLYLPDAGTLPTASASFRGVLAFQPGGAGVIDSLRMCVKLADDTYAWA